MNAYLKKILLVLLFIALYFSLWRIVRGTVTQFVIVPQIEYAISNCDEYIQFDVVRATSLRIYQYSNEREEYDIYSYTTPAGFYLLMGLVLIVLLNGKKVHYQLLVGFHIGFWVVSSITILPGLCISSLFLHVTFLGIQYLTPFITFLILTLLISPKMRDLMQVKE